MMAPSADSCWTPIGRSSGRRDSATAAGSEREPAASICDSCATAHHPDDDRFLLVVISVACACRHTRRTAFQSCGMPWEADNTRDKGPAVIAAPNRSSAWCNSLLLLRWRCTSTDGWWAHLRSRSCSDTTCSVRISFRKSCRFRFWHSLAQRRTSPCGSTLLDKILGNICNGHEMLISKEL